MDLDYHGLFEDDCACNLSLHRAASLALVYTNQLCGDPGHDALLSSTIWSPSGSSYNVIGESDCNTGDGTLLYRRNLRLGMNDFEFHPSEDDPRAERLPCLLDATPMWSTEENRFGEYAAPSPFRLASNDAEIGLHACLYHGSTSPTCRSDGYSTWLSTGEVMSSTNAASDEHSRPTYTRTPRKRNMGRRGRTSSQNRSGAVRKVTVSKVSEQPTPRAVAVGAQKPKGVTMLYRTLLRKLLAGSGWIMHSSISKENAKRLIKILMGQELVMLLEVEKVLEDIERVPPSRKEEKCNRLLADMMSCYVDATVTVSNADFYIRRLKGPYRLVEEFVQLLGERKWPPHMPSESELRYFDCYQEGEGISL